MEDFLSEETEGDLAFLEETAFAICCGRQEDLVNMASAVSVAVVSDVKDPMDLGRAQVRLSAQAGGALEWARVVSAPVGPTRTALQLDIGDEVLVVFEQANVRQPIVIGNLWNGADSPPTSANAVHLPTGSILHPVVESAETSVDCSMTADLQRQTAPWLASVECLLKILALLKPLIDIVEHLPTRNTHKRRNAG